MTTHTELAALVCREVAELTDRNSPVDWPDAMLVTHEELRAIVIAALESTERLAGGGELVAQDHIHLAWRGALMACGVGEADRNVISEVVLSMLPTTPTPQAERVPLSEGEIRKIWVEHGLDDCDAEGFARAIERAHGITPKEGT